MSCELKYAYIVRKMNVELIHNYIINIDGEKIERGTGHLKNNC